MGILIPFPSTHAVQRPHERRLFRAHRAQEQKDAQTRLRASAALFATALAMVALHLATLLQ